MLQKAIVAVKGMVTPHRHISQLRCVSQVPLAFFGEIFSVLREDSACNHYRKVMSWLPMLQSKRKLVVHEDAAFWDAYVDRRITRASQFVRAMVDDAEVLGWKGFREVELEGAILRWLVLDWTGHSTKQMKLQTVWLSGYARGVESPVDQMLDKPGYLICSRYSVFLRRLLRTGRSVTLGCPYTKSEIAAETLLLGSKRGAPSIEDDLVDENTRSYMTHMSVAKPILRNVPEIRAAIQETCMEVFGAFTENVQARPFVPSKRAGHGAPIAQGGILGDLVRGDPSLLGGEELHDMREVGSQVYEVRGCFFDWARAYAHCLVRWGQLGIERLAKCQIYTIREPLKLRTITAGTPSLYGCLQPILKFLRDGMSNFDVFRLTRKENNAAWLSERLSVKPLRAECDQELWDYFVSGDYQQSTNDLSMDATSWCRQWVFGGTAGRVVSKALGAQVLCAKLGEEEKEVVQERGQLMGSPLSFPFLCIINAAIARLAYQRVHPKLFGLSLDRFPFAVNGDDIAARMSIEVYEEWLRLVDAVGWSLSPGKSYFLRCLVQVNSQTMNILRIPEGEALGCRYVLTNPIPFVNSGFLQQMGKSVQQIDGSPVEAMSEDWKARFYSYSRLPKGMRERAEAILIRNLGEMCYLLAESGRTPFVLCPTNPVGLGGLGLPGKFDWKAAYLGMLCEEPVQEPVTSLIYQETQSRREVPPLLVWKDPSISSYGSMVHPGTNWKRWCPEIPNKGKLVDRLLEDLESFVNREEVPDLHLPLGLVTPYLKRSV